MKKKVWITFKILALQSDNNSVIQYQIWKMNLSQQMPCWNSWQAKKTLERYWKSRTNIWQVWERSIKRKEHLFKKINATVFQNWQKTSQSKSDFWFTWFFFHKKNLKSFEYLSEKQMTWKSFSLHKWNCWLIKRKSGQDWLKNIEGKKKNSGRSTLKYFWNFYFW